MDDIDKQLWHLINEGLVEITWDADKSEFLFTENV